MEEMWERLKAMEEKILEHNDEVDRISPNKMTAAAGTPVEDIASAPNIDPIPVRSRANSQLLEMRKDAKEKEFRIAQLERDLASLDSVKEQNQNLKAQVSLLTEKLSLKEQELREKDKHIAELEAVFKPTLLNYETELTQLRSLVSTMQGELNSARQELVRKDIVVADLTQTNANKDERSALMSQSKTEAEKQVESLSSLCSKLQDEVMTLTQAAREKEMVVETLEEDNGKLRTELQKSLEALQQCQNELKLIPKLKAEVSNCEQLITAASGELEDNRSAMKALIEERSQLSVLLDEIRQLTDEGDPVEYIRTLQTQLLEDSAVIAQLKSDLSKHETALRDLATKVGKANSILSDGFAWFGKALSLEGGSVIPKIQGLPDVFRELISPCETFRSELEMFRMRMAERIRDLEGLVMDNDAKASLFEESQKALKVKVEDLANHISEQETLYLELARDKERAEGELLRQIDTLKTANLQTNAHLEQLKTLAERFTKTVQPLLSEPILQAQDSSKDLARVVQVAVATLRNLEMRNRALEGELEDTRQSAQADKAALEECSRSYAVRFQDMNRQIRDLTSAIDQSEDNSKGIVDKFAQVNTDLHTARQDLERTKDALVSTQLTCKHYVSLIESLIFCLSTAVERLGKVGEMKRMAMKVWVAEVRTNNEQYADMTRMANALDLPLPKRPAARRLRTGVMAVLAAMRLKLLGKRAEVPIGHIIVKNVPFPLPKKHFLPPKLPRKDSPSDTLQALIAIYEKSKAEEGNGTRLSASLLMGLSALQRKGALTTIRLSERLAEKVMSSAKQLQGTQGELETKTALINKLEQDMKSMRKMANSLQTNQSALEDRLNDSVPKLEVANLSAELISVQEALREAERKQIDLDRVIAAKHKENQELTDAVDILQFQGQTYSTQIEQLNQELQSKRSSLKFSEDALLSLREKLDECEEQRFANESRCHSLQEQVSQLETERLKLSKQLQQVISEYRKLEKTLEENVRYCQEADAELKRRDRAIEHLRRQADEETADYKFRVSQLTAETEQLRRQRGLKTSLRFEESDSSLSRRSKG